MKNMGHRLMFSVVVLCVSAYLTYAEECLAGMQKRGDICCKPVTCKKNEDYRLCNHTHQEDSCVPCPSNTFNQHSIDTSHQFYYEKQQPNICKNPEEICVKTACPEEAKIVNHTECLRTGNVTCECDLSREFCGKDPITCEKWTGNVKELKKGIELTLDCEPMKCKPGLFKDVEGNEKCLEHRDCSEEEMIIFNGNSTMDRQCGPSNETRTTTPTESTKMFDANSTVENSSTPTFPSNDSTTDSDQIIIGVVVGAFLAVILGVLIGIILCCRNKFGRFIQRRKNAVLKNGVNNQLNGIPEEQNVSDEPTEATSMV